MSAEDLLRNPATDYVAPLTREVRVVMETEDGADFEERTVVVRRLASRRMADVMLAITSLPQDLMRLLKDRPDIQPENWLSHIGELGAACIPTVERVVAVGTGLSLDEVRRVTVDGLVELLIAVLEVNRVAVIQRLLRDFFRAVAGGNG